MGREKAIGALIFIVGLLILLYYTWGLLILVIIAPGLRQVVESIFGAGTILASIFAPSWELLVILPIWLAVLVICVIGMWIGYTMLTTPSIETPDDVQFDHEELEAKTTEEPPASGESESSE